MALELGLSTKRNSQGEIEISPEFEDRMTKLHGEMQIVLAIFLMEFQ
jgi:hypothetical protein